MVKSSSRTPDPNAIVALIEDCFHYKKPPNRILELSIISEFVVERAQKLDSRRSPSAIKTSIRSNLTTNSCFRKHGSAHWEMTVDAYHNGVHSTSLDRNAARKRPHKQCGVSTKQESRSISGAPDGNPRKSEGSNMLVLEDENYDCDEMQPHDCHVAGSGAKSRSDSSYQAYPDLSYNSWLHGATQESITQFKATEWSNESSARSFPSSLSTSSDEETTIAVLLERCFQDRANHNGELSLQETYNWFFENTNKGGSPERVKACKASIRYNLSRNSAFECVNRHSKEGRWKLSKDYYKVGLKPTMRSENTPNRSKRAAGKRKRTDIDDESSNISTLPERSGDQLPGRGYASTTNDTPFHLERSQVLHIPAHQWHNQGSGTNLWYSPYQTPQVIPSSNTYEQGRISMNHLPHRSSSSLSTEDHSPSSGSVQASSYPGHSHTYLHPMQSFSQADLDTFVPKTAKSVPDFGNDTAPFTESNVLSQASFPTQTSVNMQCGMNFSSYAMPTQWSETYTPPMSQVCNNQRPMVLVDRSSANPFYGNPYQPDPSFTFPFEDNATAYDNDPSYTDMQSMRAKAVMAITE